MDILLDTTTHDIVFDNSDTPSVTTEVRQDVAQRLKIKLSTYLGEWFLDITQGVPYYESVFKKGATKSSVDLIFQTMVLEEEDVLSIVSWDSSLDNSSRTYSLYFRVDTDSGVTDVITI